MIRYCRAQFSRFNVLMMIAIGTKQKKTSNHRYNKLTATLFFEHLARVCVYVCVFDCIKVSINKKFFFFKFLCFRFVQQTLIRNMLEYDAQPCNRLHKLI